MTKLSATKNLLNRVIKGTAGFKTDLDGKTYLAGLGIRIDTTLFDTLQVTYVDSAGEVVFTLDPVSFRTGDSITLQGVELRASVSFDAADEADDIEARDRRREDKLRTKIKEAKVALKKAKAALRNLSTPW